MLLRRRPLVVAFGLAALSGTGACASQAQYVTHDQYSELQSRVEEVERANGRLRIQLRDAEDKIYLLEDRVESARINAARTTAVWIDPRERAVRPGTQAPVTSSASPVYRSPVTQVGPPPNAHIDPLAPPRDLPVVSAGGVAPAAAVPASAAPAEEEVVIDMAAYHERFGDEPGGDRAGSSSSSSSSTTSGGGASGSTPTRRPQPPVDVGAHRLPVAAAEPTGNRVVAPSEQDIERLSPRQVYERAIEEFNDARYEEAIGSLNEFLGMGPAVDYMDNALFWMGECYYGLGQYGQALGYFQRVVSEYPNGNKVPDSMLKIALTQERLEDPTAARDALQRVVDVYPTTPAAQRAAERLRALQ